MFQRHEYADATRRRINCTSEGDDQQQAVVVHEREQDTRRHHKTRSGEQELAGVVSRAKQPDADRQERGTEERGGCDHTDRQRRKAECEQIHRQQDGDEAVAEIA
jgi:hypothetical protein